MTSLFAYALGHHPCIQEHLHPQPRMSAAAAASSANANWQPTVSATSTPKEIKEQAIQHAVENELGMKFNDFAHLLRTASRNDMVRRAYEAQLKRAREISALPDYMIAAQVDTGVQQQWRQAQEAERAINERHAAALSKAAAEYQRARAAIDAQRDNSLAALPLLSQILLKPQAFMAPAVVSYLAGAYADSDDLSVAIRVCGEMVRVAACRDNPRGGAWTYDRVDAAADASIRAAVLEARTKRVPQAAAAATTRAAAVATFLGNG